MAELRGWRVERVLEGWGIVIVVDQYRVQLRLSIGGLSAGTLREWAFHTLDALLEDARVIEADVAGTLAAGEVEYDMQVRAESVQVAMQTASDALAAATQVAAATAADGPAPVSAVEHAEVDRVPIPA
jgi:hypothetical protein